MRAISPPRIRIEDGCGVRRGLERVAVATGNQNLAAAPLFGRDRGGEEIIGFVARRRGVGEAAGGNEFRGTLKRCSTMASSNWRPLW